MAEARVVLEGRDLRQLLTGGVVVKLEGSTKVRITLADIGYMQIGSIVANALGLELKAKERLDEISLR